MAVLGVMVYGIIGTELACCSTAEIRNVRRDIPRVVLISELIVGALDIFDTLDVLIVVLAEETDVTRTFVYTLYNICGHDNADGMLAGLVNAFVLFILFISMVTWSMGTDRAAVEVAKVGELPVLPGAVYSHHGTPIGSAALALAVGIVLPLLYGLVAYTAEELFWILLSIFTVVLMIPYVLMCLAFARPCHADPCPRSYRMLLGDRLAGLWTLFTVLHVLAGTGLFVVTPGVPID